jgi:hypothetical protein
MGKRKRSIKKNANYFRGRVKFYADENIDIALVRHLRTKIKVNITSALELGFGGRGDSFHFQEAKRSKRFLLTCDKDFLNNIKFPLNHCFGVVILDIPQRFPGVGWMVVWLKEYIIGSSKQIYGTKIVLHEKTMDVHYIDETGRFQKDILWLT